MELVTSDDLMNFLGVGEESKSIVEMARESALSQLTVATDVKWETEGDSSLQGIVNEAVQTIVYLDFYGIRGGIENTDFLRSHLIHLVKQLQTGGGQIESGTS